MIGIDLDLQAISSHFAPPYGGLPRSIFPISAPENHPMRFPHLTNRKNLLRVLKVDIASSQGAYMHHANLPPARNTPIPSAPNEVSDPSYALVTSSGISVRGAPCTNDVEQTDWPDLHTRILALWRTILYRDLYPSSQFGGAIMTRA